MKKFLVLVAAAMLLTTGCAGGKYYLAELGDMDRGVVVRNDSNQLIAAQVFSISASVVDDPRTKYLQPGGWFPFRLYNVGGKTVSVYVWPVDGSGKPLANRARCDVSFPWGHEVGNAADYNRNHKSVTWDGRNLWQR